MYNAVILEAVKAFGKEISMAHIYIDGEGGNDYRRKVKSYFRKNLSSKTIKELSYRDSKTNNLIQLADMVAGATRRAIERGETDYIKIVQKKIVSNKNNL